MPRDPGTGVYTLPLPPTEPRRIPVTGWANTTVEDLAAALNGIPGTALADGSITPTKLAGMTLNGLVTRVGASMFAESVIMGTPGEIVVTNGNGVADHPSIGLASSPTLQGDVSLAGGQLSFPTAQNPSSNPNTLDDYEEGTFTPTLTYETPGNQSIVYSTRVGRYTKIGGIVHFTLRVITTTFTHTTAAGSLRIAGLPFSVVGDYTSLSVWGSGLRNPFATEFTITALAIPGTSVTALYAQRGASGAASAVSLAAHTTGENVDLMVSGSYFA